MSTPNATRRAYGSGSLSQVAGRWVGRWYDDDGRRVKRRLGPVREPGTRDGLTRAMAEREMRRRMESEAASPRVGQRMTVLEAGEALLGHLEALGRRRSTLGTYRSSLTTHVAPAIGATALAQVRPADVERLIADMRRGGSAAKTINNSVTLLGQILEHGLRRGWCTDNPVRRVDRPRADSDPDLRFLDEDEMEALLRATPDAGDRALFLTAAMTGLRQGELLALRWRDVDWPAGRVRVRRSYVRGEWGAPKSRRGVRSVPLADRVAAELDRHHQRSAFGGDDDLVFGHPLLGTVLDHSDLVRRFKRALTDAGVREVRFHDLRHTFGTRMASAGVPMRTLQEWLGHRDFKTTMIYADYQPSEHERAMVEAAFRRGPVPGPDLSAPQRDRAHPSPHQDAAGSGAARDA